MKNSIYKFTLTKDSDHTCLLLMTQKQTVRKWCGAFAELIYNKTLHKYPGLKNNMHSVYLNKAQIQTFFTDCTCLYQMVVFHFNIEKDLSINNFPKHLLNIAESLLLHIRINSIHFIYEDLQAYFLDEFKNHDVAHFDSTLKLLIGKNLIQSIITEDGQQFFDKNTKPHDHIYFKQNKKLVDCSKEISHLFSASHYFKNSEFSHTNIFNLNNVFF